MNNALFKQWVGIFLTPKIDRAHKNYLTPEIWEETHLRETFYGTLIFQQSSVICIGRHVGGHTLSLVLYCNFAPQHCAEQAPPEFLLLKYLLWEKYCNYPLTTTLGDRFASCENIVSRSQTSSLPPSPALHLASFWKREFLEFGNSKMYVWHKGVISLFLLNTLFLLSYLRCNDFKSLGLVLRIFHLKFCWSSRIM